MLMKYDEELLWTFAYVAYCLLATTVHYGRVENRERRRRMVILHTGIQPKIPTLGLNAQHTFVDNMAPCKI